ncbi:MAG: cation:proton antiporter [Acetatifactor sp.]|nr:cation:proton antiporter [Acetatifactor sp.]
MKLETLNEMEIIRTLIALALLLLGAYLFGKLFEKMKAPKVVGEIIGGMLFGGSCLYHFFPAAIEQIFMAYSSEGKVLNIFYQLGLIFLMFSSGFNTKLELDRKNGKAIMLVFVGATILPMLAAIPFVNLFQPYYMETGGNEVSFFLVFLIGVAITSIPVISKIFFDMGIMNTKFSNTVLTVSTFQDLCLWILLNAATRIASTGQVKWTDMLLVVLFTLGMFVIAKLITEKINKRTIRMKSTDFFTISFVFLLATAGLLYILGINIMYSAFLVGYIIKSFSGADEETDKRIQTISDFSFSFFIPIYFALVGIQLNVIHNFSWLRFVLFFILAFSLEAIGTVIMLLFSDFNKRTIANFAVTMNARGGPGIVLATVAYSYQIINLEFFTVLILTTMLSSLIAGYWLRMQQIKDSDIFMNLTKKKGEE